MSYAEENIVINVYLAPVVGEGAQFDVVLYLVDEAEGAGNGLDGDRFRTYNSVTDATTDEDSGFITAAVLLALQDAFSQKPTPQQILVGRVDTVGLEGYDDGLDECIDAGAAFFGIAADTRTTADLLLLSAAIEAKDFYVYALQSSDADWITLNYPVALSAIEDRERTIICWHDTDAENMALCYIVDRLHPDPDYISGPWPASLAEVAPYAATLTAGEKGFAESNDVNLGLKYGEQTFWVGAGWNAAHRSIDHIVTADWYKTRMFERFAAMVAEHSARYEKIVVDTTGQAKGLAIISGLNQEGEAAKHFVTGQTIATALAITAADLAAMRLRFQASDQLGVNARIFNINVYLGTDPVNE